MKTSYEKLLEIKGRYGLFIGCKSFKNLMLYIEGYLQCLTELFAGLEDELLFSHQFNNFVQKYFNASFSNQNWKDVLLFQCHLNDESAFAEFYKILDKYLVENPEIMEKEKARQEKFHKLQLNNDLEKVERSKAFLTSGTINEYLDAGMDVNGIVLGNEEDLKKYVPGYNQRKNKKK